MRTSSAKAKGRRCSEEVKSLLLKYSTNLFPNDILVTPSGVCGVDLVLSPAASQQFPFAIECKNQEKISIWESLKQAASHAEESEKIPVLFFKRNHSEVYVALKADDFLSKLLKKGEKNGL